MKFTLWVLQDSKIEIKSTQILKMIHTLEHRRTQICLEEDSRVRWVACSASTYCNLQPWLERHEKLQPEKESTAEPPIEEARHVPRQMVKSLYKTGGKAASLSPQNPCFKTHQFSLALDYACLCHSGVLD